MLNKLLLLALLFLFVKIVKELYTSRYGKQYYNIIPEVMIEEEYIKSLSIPDISIYKSKPSFIKKKILDEFTSNNNSLVNKIKIESAQNYTNNIITEANTNGDNGISVINKISTQPFVITLDSGAILNVVPVVKKIIMNNENEHVGVVQYDLDSTLSNVKSQISTENESEREVLYKEIDDKIIYKINENIDSGLNSASISAVATSLSI